MSSSCKFPVGSQVPEAVTRLTRLKAAYLTHNKIRGDSLVRLAGLPALRLVSFFECFPRQGRVWWVTARRVSQ